MVDDNLLIKFENDKAEKLVIVFDPPAIDFELMRGEILYLKIYAFKKLQGDLADFVTIRYSGGNVISVDINSIELRLAVIIGGKEDIIWGWDEG